MIRYDHPLQIPPIVFGIDFRFFSNNTIGGFFYLISASSYSTTTGVGGKQINSFRSSILTIAINYYALVKIQPEQQVQILRLSLRIQEVASDVLYGIARLQ